MLLPPLRIHILAILTKAYFTLPVEVVARWLLFGGEEKEEVLGFLHENVKGAEGVGVLGEVVTLRVVRRKKVG